MKHERHLSARGVPTVPYLVYLPDGKVGLARSSTANNEWAVARVSRQHGGWKVDAIHNTSQRGHDDVVATAERITEEEAACHAICDDASTALMPKEGFRLSRGAIRAINAVEGISVEMTDAIFAEIDEMEARGLTRDQMRSEIKTKYGKKD